MFRMGNDTLAAELGQNERFDLKGTIMIVFVILFVLVVLIIIVMLIKYVNEAVEEETQNNLSAE